MTSKGNSSRYRHGKTRIELDNEAKESAIRDLDLRGALEFYGLVFNAQGAALCPFHKEKTASFRVKGRFWHCFGCGDTGELIKFVQKKFRMSYIDATDAICRDFGIIIGQHKFDDLERIDFLRIERYNKTRQYKKLLDERDVCIERYLLALNVRNMAALLYGGANADNEQYVCAHFQLMAAQRALERAEYECAEYLKENPCATPVPPEAPVEDRKNRLPPAPKWRHKQQADEPNFVYNSESEMR